MNLSLEKKEMQEMQWMDIVPLLHLKEAMFDFLQDSV